MIVIRADTEGTESDFRQFMPNCNWRSYLEKMRKCGEFGDHVTLQACARRFGVQIIVLSTSGTNYTPLIPCKPVVADETSVSSPVMIVGHYPDESVEGGHFVVLSPIPPKTPQGIMVSRMHVTDSGAQTSTDIECASDDGSDLTAEDNDDVELNSATHATLHNKSQHQVLSHGEFVNKKRSYPWLLMEHGKLGCSTCRNTSTFGPEKTQGVHLSSAWVSCSISSYGQTRKQRLRAIRKKIHDHGKSTAHKAAQRITIDAGKKQIERSTTKLYNECHTTTLRVFRTAYSIAKRGRPFLDMAAEVELQNMNGLDMGRTLHSNVSCANISDHIADEIVEMRKNLVAHIIESQCKISILIDESTTVSRKTTLIVYMKAVVGELRKPQTFFFDLIELTSTTAEDIYSALVRCLKSHGLTVDILKLLLICIATDGASVMLGKESGVCSRFLRQFPRLVIWHCSNHRLELSVHDTVEEVAGINNFHIFFDKLYALYHQSPKAQRELEDSCKDLHERCLTIGRILNTSWVASSLRTVVAVWKQYEALYNHLAEAASDTSRTQRERAQYAGLKTKISTNEFVLNLGVLRDALDELADVSLQLQKEDMTLPRAHALVSRQVRVFWSMVDKPGKYARETSDAVKLKTFKNVSLKPGSKADVLIRHKQFFTSLETNFKSRMLTTRSSGTTDKATSVHNAEYTALMEALGCLDVSTWPADFDIQYGDADVVRLCERLSVAERDSIQGQLSQLMNVLCIDLSLLCFSATFLCCS